MLNPTSSRKDIIKAIATLLIGLLTLGVFIIALGGGRFWEDLDSYVIRFRTVKDLNSGRPVKFAGLQVGRVLDIAMDEKEPGVVQVVIGVDKEVSIYKGTVATISQKGLVGDNYVLLELRTPAGDKLPPGGEIPSASTGDMNELTSRAGDILADLKPRLDNIATGLERILSRENADRIATITTGAAEVFNEKNRSNLQTTLERAPKLLEETNKAVAGFERELVALSKTAQGTLNQSGKTFADAGTKLNETLTRFDQVMGRVGNDVSTTLARVSQLTQTAEASLAYDQERLESILINLDQISVDMKHLTRSLRERPWQLIRRPEGD